MRGEIVVIQLRYRGDRNPVNIKLVRIKYGITCDGVTTTLQYYNKQTEKNLRNTK